MYTEMEKTSHPTPARLVPVSGAVLCVHLYNVTGLTVTILSFCRVTAVPHVV